MAATCASTARRARAAGRSCAPSLALRCVTGTPVPRSTNIRAGRAKPGLCASTSPRCRRPPRSAGAEVSGDELGSRAARRSRPARCGPGDYRFAVGTAGSATLVLQTVLPALLIAGGPSTLVLEGGTAQPAGAAVRLPRARVPAAARAHGRARGGDGSSAHGFYPAGGGRVARIESSRPRALAPLELLERGRDPGAARARAGGQPARQIAERELDAAARERWAGRGGVPHREQLERAGPGQRACSIELEREHVTEVVTGFGEKGVRAERVAEAAVDEARGATWPRTRRWASTWPISS